MPMKQNANMQSLKLFLQLCPVDDIDAMSLFRIEKIIFGRHI